MAKFCANCGSEVNENAAFCLNCGAALNNSNDIPNNYVSNQNTQPNYTYSKPKVPGKGLSIAGMVLGIIALVAVLLSLLSVGDIEITLKSSLQYYTSTSSFVIGFAIGYTLFSLIPSIVGVILSGVGFKKSKNGLNITGLILNGIALVIALIIFIYILTFM